jgi:hypothetical protein
MIIRLMEKFFYLRFWWGAKRDKRPIDDIWFQYEKSMKNLYARKKKPKV